MVTEQEARQKGGGHAGGVASDGGVVGAREVVCPRGTGGGHGHHGVMTMVITVRS